jgi:hypothetical protein
MRDQPGPVALLKIVGETLQNDVIPNLAGPSAYQARIAASLVAIITRELQRGATDDAAESARLRALGVQGDDLTALNADLAERLRDGRLSLESADVAAHLWETTLAKMAVDQPGFARYRQLSGGDAA